MVNKFIIAMAIVARAMSVDPVCIIGGGPGGVSLAHELQQIGYTGKMVMFEREADLGGKAKTVNLGGVNHELGACYTSPDYELAFELLRETGITPQPYDLLLERTAFDKNIPHKDKCGAHDFMDWAKAVLREPPRNVPSGLELATIGAKVVKYDLIRKKLISELWGAPNYAVTGGMLTGSDANAQRDLLNITMMEFLVKNGLSEIAPLLLVAQTIQGYGLLDEIPAYYGLLWLQASTLGISSHHPLPLTEIPARSEWCGYDDCYYSMRRVAGSLKEGWQEFVRRLAQRIVNLEVHLKSTVSNVVPGPNGRARITVNGSDIQCSAVVVATGESTKIRQLVSGMHPDVEAAFDAQTIGAKWYVSLVKGSATYAAKFPIVTFVDQITTEGINYGAVESARQAEPAANPSLWDDTAGHPTRLKPCTGSNCSVWFGATIMRHNNMRTIPDLRAQQKNTFASLHFNMTGVHLEHVWPEYFPHWKTGKLDHLYKLRDRQGENGLFFAGGISHFESIEFILRYNKWLAVRVLEYLQVPLMNQGRECFQACGKTGSCSFCGTQGACCRKFHSGPGCSRQAQTWNIHTCVPSDKTIVDHWKDNVTILM